MGYHRAGFDVVGVDLSPRPNYPFSFHQGDAIEYLKAHGHLFDVIHASPPCQGFSKGSAPARKRGKKYLDLLTETRKVLQEIGKPYVIENVPGAPMRADVRLKGLMFGLPIVRERWFEITPFFIMQPGMPAYKKRGTLTGDYLTVCKKSSRVSETQKTLTPSMIKYWKGTWHATRAYAMGIDWHMSFEEQGEAIPPQYAEYVGNQIIYQLQK